MTHYCIKPACGDDCTGCNKAISEEQRKCLLNALTGGATEEVWRSYMAACNGGDDVEACERNVALGLMTRQSASALCGTLYHVTEAGAAAVGKRLPR